MDENLKKTILDNEELLELLLAINFNNKTAEEGSTTKLTYYETDGDFSEPFKSASYFDIGYTIELLNKWKNSNALEMLNEAIKRNPKEATEENIKEAKEKYELIAETQRGLYNEEVKFIKKYLNKTFLNKAYYVFYDLALGGCFTFIAEIEHYFYLINKFKVKDKEKVEALREYLKGILEEKEVNTTSLEVLQNLKDKDYNTFLHNVEVGIAFSEVLYNTTKGSYFSKETLDEFINNFKNDKGDVLEYLRKPNMSEEDIIAEYLLQIKNFLRLEELFDKAGNELRQVFFETFKSYEYKDIITKEDENKLSELTTNNVNKLNALAIENRERTIDFKNDAVKQIVSIFALDVATKKLATSTDTKANIERRRKEAYKSFNDIEPIGTTYVMSAVNPYSTAIKSLHSRIATYNENNIEVKERALANISKKIELLEAKDILTDAEIKDLDKLLKEQEDREKDIKEVKKKHLEIEKEIEAYKKEVLDYTKDYADIENKGLSEREKRLEKRKLTNNIKKLNLKINMLEKAKSSRGLYLQLALEEDKTLLTAKEEFKGGGSLTMFVENTIEGLSKYNREALNLLRYLDGQAYYLPFERYKKEDIPILIDLDNYVAETGRGATAYKSVRSQLIDAVELLQKEYFRVDGKANKYNLNIKGKIEIIGDYFILQPQEEHKGTTNTTNKTTLLLYLGHTYKQILFNEKMMQWASIPRLLMKLTDKEIKEQDYHIKKELVQDLGFYIYEEIRRNINEKSKETKGQFTGYYKLTRYFKTIVEHLQKSNALASNKNNTYAKRVIIPLEEAFSYLADLGLVEIETKAFSIYHGDEELGEAGLKKTKESTIKQAFEDAKITIIFKVINEEAYDKLLETKITHKNRAKRNKAKKEAVQEAKLLTLFEDADFKE